jgi:hypothetical protein
MKRKTILILTTISLLIFVAGNTLAFCQSNDDCQKVDSEEKRTIRCDPDTHQCVRNLEITYPQIEGVSPPPYTTGLPQYLKYIFHFAVRILGLVIFGALVYSGFQYLTSTGDPTKMAEAKSGIISAFLGGVILLSSVLLFNQINPQLTKFQLPKVSLTGIIVPPGIYVCNYSVSNIREILQGYLGADNVKTQTQNAKELQKIMWNPSTGNFCKRLNFSGEFKDFYVTNKNTIFIIPSIELEKDSQGRITSRKFKWEYGVIFHEKENRSGKADYYPKKGGTKIYVESRDVGDDPMAPHNYTADELSFTARSFTLFKKPPEGVGEGVTLYSEFQFGENATSPVKELTLDPGGDDVGIFNSGDLGELKDNAYSIKINPEGSYIAMLCKTDGCKDRVDLVTKNRSDLTNVLALGECNFFYKIWSFLVRSKACYPLLGEVIVIKGSVL